MKYSYKVVTKLNQLLIKHIDIRNSYRVAVLQAESENLKGFFSRRLDKQNDYVNIIAKEIFKHGQIPKNRNRFDHYLYVNFLKINYLLILRSEKKIAKSFIRTEEIGLKSCELLLAEKDLPQKIKSVLKTQKNKLQQTLQQEKVFFKLT